MQFCAAENCIQLKILKPIVADGVVDVSKAADTPEESVDAEPYVHDPTGNSVLVCKNT